MQLMVSQRTDEMYRPPPPRPLGMFEGQGNRLGAVTPPIAESSRTMPGAMPPSILSGGRGQAKTESKPVIPSEFSVDESQPATRIQVRLGDGTRWVLLPYSRTSELMIRITARVNLSHTVGDLRNFINASVATHSRAGSQLTTLRSRADTRAYALQTTFPNRDLNDDSETIEQAKLSNAVVVQRWL
jgi:UBX domain-containing protein 1